MGEKRALEISKAGLTQQQAAFVAAYLANPNASEAAKVAGYAFPQNGYQALKSPAVQKAIRDARSRLIETEGATMAYNTLVDLMKPGNPGNVRLGAAKYLMDAAGHGAKPESAKEKSLQDMSADELAETIARLDQALAGKADAAQPARQVIDQDTPSQGG